MLCNLLIEDVLKEFVKVPLRKLVVELSSMRLNDVASTWGRTVSQSIVLGELDCVLKEFLVFNGRVFQRNQTLGGRGMSFVIRALPVVLLHDLIEVACSVLPTFVLQFL